MGAPEAGSWWQEKQDNDNFGSKLLTVLGGPVSSLWNAQGTEQEYRDALAAIETKGPEVDLGSRYADQAARYNTQFQGAGPMSTAGDNAAYIQNLNQALGISGPVDFRDSQRAALQQGLDQQAFNQSVRDQSMMQQSGNLGGGQALALGNLTRNDIASGNIQGNLAIDQNYANRQAQYDDTLRAQALGYGQHADAYGLDATKMGNTNLQNQISNALGLQQEQTGRQMTEFQYNELMPFQAETAKQMAMADAINQKAGQEYAVRGQQIGFMGNMMGGGMGGGGGGGQQQAAPAQQQQAGGSMGFAPANYGNYSVGSGSAGLGYY